MKEYYFVVVFNNAVPKGLTIWFLFYDKRRYLEMLLFKSIILSCLRYLFEALQLMRLL